MTKKLLALLLALMMTFSLITVAASAASADLAPVATDDDDYDYDEDLTEVSADGNFKFRISEEYPVEAYLISYLGSSTSVVIPSTIKGYPVKGIWSNAFYGSAVRNKITSITLPENIEDVSNGVFSSIPNVKTINVPAKVKHFTFDRSDVKSTAWFKNLPSGIVYLGSMAIGYKGTVPAKLNFKAGTTAVCEDAFVNKTAIKSVGLPSGMVYIGSRAFVGCTGLLDVVVPATVTYIGAGAFGFKKYEWVEEYSEEGEDDYDELVKTPLSGFTLYGAKYSEAASYAKDEKIKIEYTAVTPKITKFQNVNGGTTVYWNKDANAKYYRVFGMTSKGWQTICSKTTASSFTYKYKTPISGKYYYYTVRALSANGRVYTSGYNKNGWKYMYIAPPAKPKLANTKNGVKVTVTKPKGATYLRIFRKTGSGGWTKVADTSNTSIVDKNAKNGVTYYYTARVINKTGTKYLSAFNSGSSIKCRR